MNVNYNTLLIDMRQVAKAEQYLTSLCSNCCQDFETLEFKQFPTENQVIPFGLKNHFFPWDSEDTNIRATTGTAKNQPNH